jgi:hypothetical protein
MMIDDNTLKLAGVGCGSREDDRKEYGLRHTV